MRARFILGCLVCLLLAGCAGIPSGVEAVDTFDVDRYLGVWFEIARLDHSFERDLSNVTAVYSRRKDRGIDVINRGFNTKTGNWQEARGRAYPVGRADSGRLKVSFFGPFYGGYNIIDLDHENYSFALVCGPSRAYLWILAREKKISDLVRDQLINKAKASGFDTDALIFVEHDT